MPAKVFLLNMDESDFQLKDNNDNNIEVIDEDLNNNMDLISFMDKDKDSFVNNPNKLTISETYDIYKKEPSKQNLNKVVKSLGNTINYSLSANNASNDPLLASKAKLITAKAIKEFDPGYKVSLPTYVSSQLQKLTRVARDLRNPIKLPERFVYESQALKKAEDDFMDEYGREPDLSELSDASGMSIKKIADIRRKSIKQMSEAQRFSGGEDESEDNQTTIDETAAEGPDFLDEAEMYVYNGLDHKEKKVFEHLTGYGSTEVLTPSEISQRFDVSQSTISRLAKKFSKDIKDTYDALEEVYAK